MAPLQAFQPGVESALLFVQQTIEEHDGRLQIILWTLPRLPGGPLLLPQPALGGTIKIAALALSAIEPALLRQLSQGVLGRHMHHRFQFIGEVSCRGLGHQRGRRVQQRAVAGKVDVAVRPQPPIIVLSEGVQGVIGSAMGVAGPIGQGGQFAEHGQIDGGAQGRFELRQRGDGGVLEERFQPL